MGEIADAMLSGEICEGCQCELQAPAPGFPRRCKRCKKDAANDPAKQRAQQAKHDHRGQPLAKWQLQTEDPVIVRYHCKFCPGHFAREGAVWDHLRDVHGVVQP